MSEAKPVSRREAMQTITLSLAAGGVASSATSLFADTPRVLSGGKLPNDRRLGKLKNLNGYFPFTPSKTPEAWADRAEYVRRQILLAAGQWPQPTKTPLRPVVHGKIDRDDYTVEKVYFETFPGLYITGSLYKPKGKEGKLPGVLCPHGHWPNGRFHDHGEAKVKNEIKAGAEKFEVGGRYPLQARCVQLARMGCVVFHYDMLGYADSVPLPTSLTHGFRTQRPELSKPNRWGLFSAQSELRLLNSLGLQTHNSTRALDWLLSMPEIDEKRIAVTGASGGGTQTFILSAIDDRVTVSFPAVMVSTAMQGGCTCENATYLRVGTGNIEFAAMVAPRPLSLSAANDWTVEIETKGLPELRQHYKMMGVPDRVDGKHFPFPHNYNAVSRAFMFEFLNKHFELGLQSPIVEKDYKPLTTAELSVWDDKHPKPKSDVAAELKLLRGLDEDSNRQIKSLTPKDKKSLAVYRRIVGGAVDVMIGRTVPAEGEIEYEKLTETDKQGYKEYTSYLRYKKHGEELPTIFLLPNDWNKQVVIWISEAGKAALYGKDGKPTPEVSKLVASGVAVAGVDLLYQGEFLVDGKPLTQAPVVANPRQFAGYTMGYNSPLFSQRVHDILSVIAYSRNHKWQPEQVHLVGFGQAGPLVAAACVQAGDAVDSVALGTDGFRFATITDIRDPNLFPGAVKYGDVPGLLSLCAPNPLWLAGEGKQAPPVVTAAYRAAGNPKGVTSYAGPTQGQAAAAVKWLLG